MIELLFESIRVSLHELQNNKMRTFLTTLGIIIGVMTVIIIVSIIAGLQAKVQDVFSSIGSNVIYIERRGWVSTGMRDFRKQMRNYVDLNDYKKIKSMLQSGDMIGLSITNMFNIKYKNEKMDLIRISGITANGLIINNYKIDIGVPLSEDDIKYRKNVCLIGQDIKETLFKYENPIGKWITIDGKKYIVQGVLAKKGSIFGQSMDEYILIPYTVMLKYYPDRKKRISIQITSQNPEETIEEARWIMRINHRLKTDDPDNFAINTQNALMDKWKSLTLAIYFVMIAVGTLSLFVGGIGIMNIMLVSVSERTREIGIRKSIGAKNKEILLQFLFEAMVVSVTGGIIGILLGFIIAFLISKFSNLPFAIQTWSVILGFLFSVSVGLFFGIFPARKAAKLDPVECLRYE